ncbi:hypothetical protein [Frondihabitans cladoniiphilus]|uniref:Uncharacterized protein n=1 Tax=Frondihabitans cladoniiphilus TaxID=715785 RepID=A0ABP8W584_9MICO
MTAQLDRTTTTATRLRTPLRAAEIGLSVLALVAALLILLDPPGVVRAVVVLIPSLLLPGWVAVRRFPGLEPASRLLFTAVGSIVLLTAVSLLMVVTHLWHPRLVVAVILVLAAAAVVLRPVGGDLRLAETPARASSSPSSSPSPSSSLSGGAGRRALPWLALAVGAALWVVGLALTNSTSLGSYGLLAAFPVFWYLAVALVFAVVLYGLFTAQRARGVLAAGLGLLVTILYMSANLVENAPRLPWLYKHIAVTAYIEAHGSVNPSIDIYNRWPGFFSFSASLGTAIGYTNPVSYAGWAELAFALVDAVLVLAIVRTLTANRRLAWTAVLVFSIVNWIGQNYYSPQAFAFVLYLTIVLLALKTLRGDPRRVMRWFEAKLGAPARRRGLALNAEVVAVTTGRRGRIVAIVAILLLQAVIVVSHQLTPYVAILTLLPLFVLGYLRPLWVAVALVVLPVAYLVPNLGYVQQHFGLFSSFDPLANATTASVSSVGVSQAAALQSHGVQLLTVLTIVLALAGFVRRILQGHIRTTLIVAWLAFAPVFTFFGQSYGGEGKFRVVLFGLPFYALGIGWLFWSSRPRGAAQAAPGGAPLLAGAGQPLLAGAAQPAESAHPRRRNLLLGVTTTVLLALFVGTYYQAEAAVKVDDSDVKSAEWLDARFGPQDVVVSLGDDFPYLIGANYPNYSGYQQAGSFADIKTYTQNVVDASTAVTLLKQYAPQGHIWIAFSDAQNHAAEVAGFFTAGQLESLEAAVAKESTLRYDKDGARVYDLTK